MNFAKLGSEGVHACIINKYVCIDGSVCRCEFYGKQNMAISSEKQQ